ncbi:MAG: AsmA family protein [Steroidobacteraceae bacterium]
MVRISRRLIWISLASVVGLAVLAVAALVIAALAIDPNRLKPRLQQAFTERTGRSLELQGDLAWRFFPWIVIRSGGGSVGNPPGFEGSGFASWRTLRLGVQLLPLFDRQIIVDRIEIDGLKLDLRRAASGAVNWQLPEGPVDATVDAAEEGGSSRLARLQFAVDSVQLSDAQLGWSDEVSKQAWRTEALALQFRIPGRATPERVSLRDIAVKGRLGGTPLPRIVDVAFEAPRLDYDAKDIQVRLPGWKGAFAGAALEGGVEAQLGGEDRRLDGRIAARVESLREVLRAVGIELPRTTDRDVFGNVEFSSEFAIDEGRIATDSLQIRLDDTHFRGRAERQPIEDGLVRFAITGDTIDVDRYLEPAEAKSEPFALQLAWLKALKAEGELALTEARVGGVVMKGLRVNVE